MEKQTLHFEETLVDGITYAVMNFFQLVCCLILYILTIWVPYVNIGTTIAMSYLPVKIAKEEAISPTHIFNAGYRKHMSHFFILCGIMLISFIPALCFFVVPAIVLYWAWSLSFYFLLEKGKSPIEALKASYDATDGSKWCIFRISMVIGIAFFIAYYIVNKLICEFVPYWIFIILNIVIVLIHVTILYGLAASIWKQLKDNVE